MADEITQAEREAWHRADEEWNDGGGDGRVSRLLDALAAAEKRADDNFADLFTCTSHVRDLEEQVHRMKERAEEETQAAIEAEARAGRAACDLARLQPLIDAAVAYERAHSIAASAAPVLRAAAGEAVADARDALGHAALEVAEVLRG